MNKENFIERILNSTEGIQRAMPDDDLFTKIQNKIEFKKEPVNKSKWLIAASVTILFSINAFVLFHKNKAQKNDISILVEKNNNQIY